MNPIQSIKEKPAFPKAAPHNKVLIVQDKHQPFHTPSELLPSFCQVHVANTEQEAMEILQEEVNLRMIISNSVMLSAGNFRLLKYLQLNQAYQRLPLVQITPVPGDPNRIVTMCFQISNFSLLELPAEGLSDFVQQILRPEVDEPSDHHGVRTAYATGKLLSRDEIKWMNALESLVLQHLSEPSYNMAQLAFDLHLGRSTLSRKVQCLFGINPGEYITRIRMQKALHYLETRHYGSIAEIASAVGFKHAASFSRCFHHHYSMPPSELLK